MHKLFTFVLCGTVLLFIVSCKTDELTEFNAAELELILKDSVSSDSIPVERFPEIDSYESFFLAQMAAAYNYTDEAVLLARQCWKNQSGFIGERAAELCINLNLEAGNLSEAEFYASLASAEYPESYSFKRLVAEAEYWQHEDEDLFDSLSKLDEYSEVSEDYELLLFKAVAAFRLKLPEWKDYWLELFHNVPASDYIRRGWDYLSLEVDSPYQEFPDAADLVKAKYLYAIGKYREASAGFFTFLSAAPLTALTETVIIDMENSFLRSGDSRAGASILEETAVKFELPECLFAAARLYRRAGLYYDAGRCMEMLLDNQTQRKISERELWYSFDIKVRRSISDAVDSIDYYISRWEDPDFFTDSLNSLCTELARRQKWSTIRELALKLEQTGPSEVYERCRYISERAAALGFLDKTVFSVPYKSLYYRILTGDSLSELEPEHSMVNEQSQEAILNDVERYIDGLLRYRQNNVVDELKKYGSLLSEEFLSSCADALVSSGRTLDSIRIMYQYNGILSSSGLKRLYPAVYRDEIEKNAAANDIPVQLMLGIVWKESGFEKQIVSRSGAVGLSQLMPSTAEDVARRNRITVSDLTDPDENIALGSWYLNWLRGYVGNTAAAVLSYNGGPGRVKGWLRDYSDLPEDLVYEIVPIAETHQYGKRVLTAAVLYGLLYYNIEPDETLRIFFF